MGNVPLFKLTENFEQCPGTQKNAFRHNAQNYPKKITTVLLNQRPVAHLIQHLF